MSATEHHPVSKPESLFKKLTKVICCSESCRVWCEDCLAIDSASHQKPKKLTKDDIQHITHQPASISSSCSASAAPDNVSHSGSDVSSPRSFRERMDSDKSSLSRASSSRTSSYRERIDSDQSNLSRKGSTSSNPDAARKGPSITPIIDMKPIEFWTTNRESIQPRTPRRRMPSESELSLDNFQLDLYESIDSKDEPLTDEQKLARFNLGQVHLSLLYDIPNNALNVRIIEARELPLPRIQDVSRQDMAHSNPYAKICLLPDQKNSRQTSVQRKTQDPTWDEVFEFELPFKEVQRRTLEVTIKDFDKYSRHCIIGQVHLPLEGINLIKGGHMWKPLQPSNKEQPDLGEILISLNYLPTAGRLNVDVIKARQLLQTDLVGGSDPFVKLTLCQDNKTLKTRKTSVKKNTIDPVFNESVSFNLTLQQLESCSLVISVWDHNSKSRDDFVGRIVLGKNSTGAYEVTHWNRMLQCQRSPIAQWHTLLSREECDQISAISHAVS